MKTAVACPWSVYCFRFYNFIINPNTRYQHCMRLRNPFQLLESNTSYPTDTVVLSAVVRMCTVYSIEFQTLKCNNIIFGSWLHYALGILNLPHKMLLIHWVWMCCVEIVEHNIVNIFIPN